MRLTPMTYERSEQGRMQKADGESRRRRWYAGGAVAVVAIVVALVLARTGDTTAKVSTEGAPSAGSFQMLDGSSASFEKYRGRPLVVNFFGSWCAPCLAEMPGFERTSQDLGGRWPFWGLAMVVVAITSSRRQPTPVPA